MCLSLLGLVTDMYFDFSQLHLCLIGNKDTNSYKAFKCCFVISWTIALLQHLHVSRAEVESRNQRILLFSGIFPSIGLQL